MSYHGNIATLEGIAASGLFKQLVGLYNVLGFAFEKSLFVPSFLV
jgi:hypothetical protein